MEYLSSLAFAAVVFVIGAYIYSRIKDPRRHLTDADWEVYSRFETIMSIYPKRRFFGSPTREEGWFIQLRDNFISVVRTYTAYTGPKNPDDPVYNLSLLLRSRRNETSIDQFLILEILSVLHNSLTGYHGMNESTELRYACQLDLQRRFELLTKRTPLAPAITDYFGEEYINLITGKK